MVIQLYVVPKSLDSFIKKSGFKVKFLAETLGLTYEGFRKKCLGNAPFRKLEADTLASLLGMTEDEKANIFLPTKSTEC